jgi:hypothetical protein
MTKFKEAMSKVSNTVSLLAFSSEESHDVFRAVTISSLISVSVTENEEEVLFVLKKDSSAGKQLVAGKNVSINVLSHLQSDIAQFYGGGAQSSKIGSNQHTQYWDFTQEVPTLIQAHLVFSAVIDDKFARNASDVYVCRISSLSIAIGTEPLIYYLRKYQSPNPYFL